MAVIGSKPNTHLINTDKAFRDLAKSGLLKEFRTDVQAGTFPRSGIDHPTMAIGDKLEFVSKSTKGRLVAYHKDHVYEIKDILLERDMHTFEWGWCIEFGEIGGVV